MTTYYIVFVILAVALFVVGIISLVLYGIASLFKKSPNISMETNKTTAKDIFIYLGIFITLCVSVGNFIQIIFTAIDLHFRDVVNTAIQYDMYNDSVRFSIASLCVLFPLYVLLSFWASKDISKFLFKRELFVRKLMIYTALFVTVCTLVGTLITAIYRFLGGELTSVFAWKSGTVLLIALFVFGYYYYVLKRNYMLKTIVPYVSAIAVSVIVIASVVWSIRIIGTPAQMRAKRLDNTRLTSLSNIQSQIYNSFQSKEKLPTTLDELTNAMQGFAVPIDPVTGSEFGYKVDQQPTFKMNYVTNRKEIVLPAIFELCATFDTVRSYNSNGIDVVGTKPTGVTPTTDARYSATNFYYDYDTSPFWNHDVGLTCFKRVISADMYYGNGVL